MQSPIEINEMQSLIDMDDDSLDLIASQYKYGLPELYGSLWQNCQIDPEDTTCDVEEVHLTVRVLKLIYRFRVYEVYSQATQQYYLDPPPSQTMDALTHFDLPTDKVYRSMRLTKKLREPIPWHSPMLNNYFMLAGPGVLMSVAASRKTGPYWSEVALAVYRHYETQDLRYVFRLDVINRDTCSGVKEIYERNGLKLDHHRMHWKFDTPEHRAIMATPHGMGAAALVLGGFERGTRCLSEIITWADPVNGNLQMLFIIGNLPGHNSVSV